MDLSNRLDELVNHLVQVSVTSPFNITVTRAVSSWILAELETVTPQFPEAHDAVQRICASARLSTGQSMTVIWRAFLPTAVDPELFKLCALISDRATLVSPAVQGQCNHPKFYTLNSMLEILAMRVSVIEFLAAVHSKPVHDELELHSYLKFGRALLLEVSLKL